MMNADKDQQPTSGNPVTQRLGQYELRERLRYGSLSDTWKAFDTHDQRTVALKLFQADLQQDPNFTTRFLNEMEVAASLIHPNIVQVYDYQLMRQAGPQSEQSKRPLAYMAMEYVEGPPHNETLADYIAQTSQQRKFPPPEALIQLFTAIGQAVDYAHQQGVMHRAIQPANILFAQDNNTTTHQASIPGRPMLMGFGLFRVLGPAAASPLYIAPEQAQGYPGNERSDIYALGAILYELCTGVPLFRGDTPAAIARQHLESTPTSPVLINQQIPPALTMVILRSLSRDPSSRFSSASSLAAALAEALNVPLPEGLDYSPLPTDAMSEPTYITPITPQLPNFAAPGSSGGYQQLPQSNPGSVLPPGSTPTGRTPNMPMTTPTSAPGGLPAMTMPPPLAPGRTPQRQQSKWFVPVIILLLLVLIGSGAGALFWFTQTHAPATSGNIVGAAFFVSSGQLGQNGSQGVNDGLQINLHNIADPAAGKSYYVWLLGDANQPTAIPLLLGKLKVKQGTAHLSYPQGSSVPHINLLAAGSRLLITEEDASTPPVSPSLDHSTWRYSAVIPQKPDPNDAHGYTMLNHLRALLADDQTLSSQGLYGGLNVELQRSAAKILEWAGSARDYWDSHSLDLMRAHFARILDYLDGQANVGTDVPGTPLIVNAPVALIGTDASNTQNPLSNDYLHLISGHLNAIAQAPGVTAGQQQSIVQIITEMSQVRKWLEQVHTDVKQLINLPDAQLLSPTTLLTLDDMVTQAFYAYVGQLNPSTNQVQAGVVEISYDIERLATFNVTTYTA